jgi:dipeptidase D
MDMKLASVDGGGLRNAIPREAVAVIMVNEADVEQAKSIVAEYEQKFVAEFAGVEDSIAVAVAEAAAPEVVMGAAKNLIRAILACFDGVYTMSMSMEGLVQTSNNLARVVSDNNVVKVQCLARSSIRSEKEALGSSIKAALELGGFAVELSGAYDGWAPNMQSPILKAMLESYEALYGKKPAVTAIHAGLECGIIGSNYPGLDMISFGPTICYPHSPDEKVEIASVEKFYDFLLHTLKNAPKK